MAKLSKGWRYRAFNHPMIIFDGIKEASHSTMGNMALLDIAGVEPTSLRNYAMFCTTLNYISFCFYGLFPSSTWIYIHIHIKIQIYLPIQSSPYPFQSVSVFASNPVRIHSVVVASNPVRIHSVVVAHPVSIVVVVSFTCKSNTDI